MAKKGPKIAMAIVIVLLIAAFAGFGADYVGDYISDKCTENVDYVCCEYNFNSDVNIPTEKRANYVWDEPGQCTESNAEEVDESLCKDSYKSLPQSCRDKKQVAFTIFSAIVGGIVLLFGFIVGDKNNSLSGGLLGGAVAAFLIAIISYWSKVNALMRVIFIAVLLALFIWLTYKKLND